MQLLFQKKMSRKKQDEVLVPMIESPMLGGFTQVHAFHLSPSAPVLSSCYSSHKKTSVMIQQQDEMPWKASVSKYVLNKCAAMT